MVTAKGAKEGGVGRAGKGGRGQGEAGHSNQPKPSATLDNSACTIGKNGGQELT